MGNDTNQRDPILRINEVGIELGLGKSSIYALVKNGDLPAPIKITSRASGWLLSWINDYKQKRIEASLKDITESEQKEPIALNIYKKPREEQLNIWRNWLEENPKCTNFETATNHAKLKKCISSAHLRLSRIDDRGLNNEVRHAIELLECALSGKDPKWP